MTAPRGSCGRWTFPRRRFHRLAVPVECTSAARFFGDVGSMGEAVRVDPHLCHPRERASSRRLYTSSARHSIGLSSDPTTIHPYSRRIGGVHIATLPKRPPRGVSNPWHSWRHPHTAICRRHDFFHPEVLGGRAHTPRHDGYLGFFRPPTEPSKVVLHRLWTIR